MYDIIEHPALAATHVHIAPSLTTSPQHSATYEPRKRRNKKMLQKVHMHFTHHYHHPLYHQLIITKLNWDEKQGSWMSRAVEGAWYAFCTTRSYDSHDSKT